MKKIWKSILVIILVLGLISPSFAIEYDKNTINPKIEAIKKYEKLEKKIEKYIWKINSEEKIIKLLKKVEDMLYIYDIALGGFSSDEEQYIYLILTIFNDELNIKLLELKKENLDLYNKRSDETIEEAIKRISLKETKNIDLIDFSKCEIKKDWNKIYLNYKKKYKNLDCNISNTDNGLLCANKSMAFYIKAQEKCWKFVTTNTDILWYFLYNWTIEKNKFVFKKISTIEGNNYLSTIEDKVNIELINDNEKELLKSYMKYTEIDSDKNNYYVKVDKINWIFLKGNVLSKNTENYSSSYFLAIKVLNKWKVVFVWQDYPFCKNIEKYNFPKNYIEWCFETPTKFKSYK